MRSKPVDIFIIILILLYTLLVIVYLAIDDVIEESDTAVLVLQVVELVFLFIFCIEITLNLVGFGVLFIKDYWNIADMTVILLAIIFVICDMLLRDSFLSNIFRLRGLFRLLRVGILIRKFDAIRKKSAARKKMIGRDIYHIMSPAEIVNNILGEIRDMIDDKRLLDDINYCIKMISSGKLYEANINEGEGGGDEKANEVISWINNIQGKGKKERKNSFDIKQNIEGRMDTININERLNLTAKSKFMLEKANTLEFNIFDFKNEVEEQELFVLTSYMMHKHELFRSFKMDPEVFFKFVKRAQDYYNHSFIEYHNKTHGADVCQTSYFFLNGCGLETIGDITDLEYGALIISTA